MMALLDTLPDRISASSLTMTRMSSPGNSVFSCCSRPSTPASTTTSYWMRCAGAPDDQADGAGALAVDQNLARLDDDGIGDRRVRDRDARDVELGGEHRRAAGRQRNLRILGRGRGRGQRLRAGADDGVPAGCCAATAAAGRQQRDHRAKRRTLASPEILNGPPLQYAWPREWSRRCRPSAAAGGGRLGRRPHDGTACRRLCFTGGRLRLPEQLEQLGAVGDRGRHVERIAQRQRDAAFLGRQRELLGVVGRQQQGDDAGRDGLALGGGALLVVARARRQHLDVAQHDPRLRLGDILAMRTCTSTSTRVPGMTNPATPIISFTRIDTARMPSGMLGGKPAPAPTAASLASVSGSFSDNRHQHAAVHHALDLGERRRAPGWPPATARSSRRLW